MLRKHGETDSSALFSIYILGNVEELLENRLDRIELFGANQKRYHVEEEFVSEEPEVVKLTLDKLVQVGRAACVGDQRFQKPMQLLGVGVGVWVLDECDANLKELLGSTREDVWMKDFLDGEIADIKLTIDQKIPYDNYLYSTKQRNSKLTYLYMTDQAYVKELVTVDIENDLTMTALTNKTFAISLYTVCIQNLFLCEKL